MNESFPVSHTRYQQHEQVDEIVEKINSKPPKTDGERPYEISKDEKIVRKIGLVCVGLAIIAAGIHEQGKLRAEQNALSAQETEIISSEINDKYTSVAQTEASIILDKMIEGIGSDQIQLGNNNNMNNTASYQDQASAATFDLSFEPLRRNPYEYVTVSVDKNDFNGELKFMVKDVDRDDSYVSLSAVKDAISRDDTVLEEIKTEGPTPGVDGLLTGTTKAVLAVKEVLANSSTSTGDAREISVGFDSLGDTTHTSASDVLESQLLGFRALR